MLRSELAGVDARKASGGSEVANFFWSLSAGVGATKASGGSKVTIFFWSLSPIKTDCASISVESDIISDAVLTFISPFNAISPSTSRRYEKQPAVDHPLPSRAQCISGT